MVGTISTILAATIVNVAFPALLREFHVGHDSLQWVATGFLAATTTTMLATSWLVDSFGQRNTFVVTMAVFLAASLLGASSWNIESLIAARVLQGAAAGVMQPLAMIAVFEVFPVEQRGRAMGVFGFGVVLAPAVGPAVGGLLTQAFGWRAIFLLSLPFCVAALPLGWRWLSSATPARPRLRFDWIGVMLLAGALVSLLNLPVVAHRQGWFSALALGDAITTLVLSAAFVAWQFHARMPLLPVRQFSSRGFRAALMVAIAYGLGLFGTTYLVPVFVQDIAGYGPARAGNLLVAPGFALALAIALGGRLTDRIPPRHVVVGGLACFALSSLLLAFASAATAFWLLALWLTIGRIGLGFIIPALNVGAVESLPPQYLGQASAAVNFARQLGGAVGVNLLAVVLDWRLSVYGSGAAATLAFHDCFLVVTIAFAAAAIPATSVRKHTWVRS
jgi:MFS transporter, DHA2 family, multidrug resistance protein